MPQRTALRRVSTVVVGVLFAVVFVCSGASASHSVAKHGKSAAGVHTSTSKATVRMLDAPVVKQQTPAPIHLATTGPAAPEETPTLVAESIESHPVAADSPSDFTTSERAPPAP